MTRDQKTVLTGALSGIAAMAVLVWLLATTLAPPDIPDLAADRLAYAARWLVVAVLPLFAMLAAIGNARFLSEAIDPTLGKESRRLVVDGRVADNTTQQFVVFAVALLALSVMLPQRALAVIPAVTIAFVVARVAFWVGYRIHPLYRAPGFSATAYLNLGMLIASLWLWLA